MISFGGRIMVLALILGCSHGSLDERRAAEPAIVDTPIAKPANGSPIAMRARAINPTSLDIAAHNFSDRRLALYDIDVVYRDGAGGTLLVHEGPMTEKSQHLSFTGGTYICEPRSDCELSVELTAPAGAVAADIVVTRVKSDDNQLVFSAS